MTGVNCSCTVSQLNLENVLQNQHFLTRDGAFARSQIKTIFSLQAPLEPGLCNYRYCRWWKAEGTIYFLVADQKYSHGLKKKKKKVPLICFGLCVPSTAQSVVAWKWTGFQRTDSKFRGQILSWHNSTYTNGVKPAENLAPNAV